MAESDETDEQPPAKRSRKPLLLGLVLALCAAGGGFFAASKGLIPGTGGGSAEAAVQAPVEELPDLAFVPVEPIVVSLGPETSGRHLRFRAQLEVAAPNRQEVEMLLPRVVDVLNGYLRSVTPADLEAPAALVRLRAQMLRRVQLVTGEGRVRDLLVMEFVLN
ncbi:MAG: flagellar basal body-associated protein FliL [Paracoccaceae bacterium]